MFTSFILPPFRETVVNAADQLSEACAVHVADATEIDENLFVSLVDDTVESCP